MSIKGTPQKKKKNAGPVKKAPTVISMVAHQKQVATHKASANELGAKIKHLNKHIKELQALLTETEAAKETLQLACVAANNEICAYSAELTAVNEKRDRQVTMLSEMIAKCDTEKMDLRAINKDLDAQIKKLTNFVLNNVVGEPSKSEGAIDCMIRAYTTLCEKYNAVQLKLDASVGNSSASSVGGSFYGRNDRNIKVEALKMLQTLGTMRQKDQVYILQQLCGNIHRQALERVAKLKNDSGYAEMTLNNIEELFSSMSDGTMFQEPENELR